MLYLPEQRIDKLSQDSQPWKHWQGMKARTDSLAHE